MLAEVMHFYGLSWSEILNMEGSWFYKFYHRIQVIEARRLLPWLDVMAYPHLATKGDRQKISDSLQRRAGYKALRHLAGTSPAQQESGWARLRTFGRPAAPSASSEMPSNGTAIPPAVKDATDA